MLKTLTEKEAEQFLEKEKFNIVKRDTTNSVEEISKIQKKIKFPWAVKINSTKVVHKGRVGGVVLNINNVMQAQEAFDKLSKIEGFEGVIIQEMFSGEEAIIGIKKTPEFGHVIMFGHGGSNVEKEKDVSFRVLPATKKDLKEMVRETKFLKTLEEKGIDLKLIEEILIKVEALVTKHPKIIEIDINPLVIANGKTKIIDARMVIEE